jgi:4-hydroxy-2-oxoheptanedioate aldolase
MSVTWGVHLSFLCADLVEFVGTLGFRWLFLDAQRTPVNPQSCRELVRAADVAHMFCMVRVTEISAPVIESYLDAGVLGILAPNISSAAQAHALVEAVKYSPQGHRGAAFRSRSARFGLHQSPAEICLAANRDTFTAALVESQRGIEELEAIASVPGLDYVSIGANDLALSLGITAGATDSRVRAMVEDANSRLRVMNKPQIAVVSDVEQARSAIVSGAQWIAVSDAALIATSGRLMLEITGQREHDQSGRSAGDLQWGSFHRASDPLA